MSFCEKCGLKLNDTARFCPRCGSKTRLMYEQEFSERKQTYDGEIRKCPNCGEILKSFTPSCPTCGYELRNSKTTNYIYDFTQKLEAASTTKQKDDLIRHFVMPNTKEDIYEFIILAATNVEKNGDNTDAWFVKLEQAYNKAKMIMGGSSDFQNIETIYTKAIKDYNKTARIKKATSFTSFISLHWKGIVITVLSILAVISFLLVPILYDKGLFSFIFLFIGFGLVFAILGVSDIEKKNDKDKK